MCWVKLFLGSSDSDSGTKTTWVRLDSRKTRVGQWDFVIKTRLAITDSTRVRLGSMIKLNSYSYFRPPSGEFGYTLISGGDSGFTNRAGSMRLLTRIDNMYSLCWFGQVYTRLRPCSSLVSWVWLELTVASHNRQTEQSSLSIHSWSWPLRLQEFQNKPWFWLLWLLLTMNNPLSITGLHNNKYNLSKILTWSFPLSPTTTNIVRCPKATPFSINTRIRLSIFFLTISN